MVRLPNDANLVPEYHVFTGAEITKLTRQHYKEYMDSYKLRHEHDYDVSKGDVPNLKYTHVSAYRGGWHNPYKASFCQEQKYPLAGKR